MKFAMRPLARLVLMFAAAAVLGGAVMLLWNLVVPGLFAGSLPIDYWRALGLLALCRILFGGFRGHGGMGHGRRWRQWQAMSDDERAQFKQRCARRGASSAV